MEISVLGPLEVRHDGETVAVDRPILRILLSVLVMNRNRVVSVHQIVDALWEDEPPDALLATLQAHVSRLRRALAPGGVRVVHRKPGYVLETGAETIDAERFARAVEEVRELAESDPSGGVKIADAALALWRGEAYADVADKPFARSEVVRLRELRLALIELRIDARLRLGEHQQLLPELQALVVSHPMREGLWARQMVGLYRCGRQADALASYGQARTALLEHAGLEPGAELRQIEHAILAQDVALDLPSVPPPAQPLGSPCPIAYTTSDGYSIAWQAFGDGPDLIFVPGFVSNVELQWEHPDIARFLHRLASRFRLILYDKRGTGLSDRVPVSTLPSIEERVHDIEAVLHAAGSSKAHLFGFSEGGALALLFASRHPERVERIVSYGTFATAGAQTDYEATTVANLTAAIKTAWGSGILLAGISPSLLADPESVAFLARVERQSASPSVAAALFEMVTTYDVADALPKVAAPTLVLHRRNDVLVPADRAKDVAGRLPAAKLVILDGADHPPYFGDAEALLREIEGFLPRG